MLGWSFACGQALDTGETGESAADTGEPAPADLDYEDGNFLYQTEQVLDFAVELSDEAIAALAAEPKEDVHATFRFYDETYDVALHLKGSSSGSFRTLDEKASFKIDFHQWDKEQEFHGVRRLTLNNMIQDSTMSHEHAAYELFRRVGVPCSRHGYAKVSVNGEPYGLYGIVETLDEQWIKRTFPDDKDGNLYEGGYGGDLYENGESNFTVKEQDDVTDLSDLTALIAAIVEAPAGDILPVIEAEFESDELFLMWATELVIADADGYLTWGNNFMLYHAPIEDSWTMIPWGPDQSFEQDLTLDYAYEGELAALCQADTACVARLYEAVAVVADAMAEADYADFVDTETARIETDCRTDPRSEWGDYGCRDAQQAMRDWVKARPAAFEALLAE
jgi:hypothetical protein